MKQRMIWMPALLLIAGFVPAVAQDEEEAETYVYASYFECDSTRLAEVDELMGKTAPIYDKAKTDGEIANWGWLRHHTGGKWRRLFYVVGSDANALMDTLDALGERTDEVEGADAFGEICGDHEDYVWRQAANSPVSAADEAGSFGVSQYYRCSFNGEGFADSIVESHFAEVFNAHVGEGKLVSWSWLAHQIGGEFRRLLAFRAASRADLLNTWGEIVGALSNEHGGALRAFSDICFAHEDYLWMSGS
ncbi:MAG: hypothetical protein OES47_04285 [Acidobacteriota bacterium]|nr:hypothetical protein [Acidobacteriota bacterium]